MFFVIEAKIQFVFGMHDRSQLFGVNNPKCICSKCKNSEVFSYKLPLQRHLRKRQYSETTLPAQSGFLRSFFVINNCRNTQNMSIPRSREFSQNKDIFLKIKSWVKLGKRTSFNSVTSDPTLSKTIFSDTYGGFVRSYKSVCQLSLHWV